MLDLYQLRTFFFFGMVKSHKETARLLHVTQPAVSHALKKLEQSTGSKLIEKRGQTYVLTDAGQHLYRSCETIFYEIERTEDLFQAEQVHHPVQLRLGSTVEFGTTLLVRRMKNFSDTHPHIHVDYHFSHGLFDRLMKNEVDLIVDCWTHQHPALEIIPLIRERYAVVASPAFLKNHAITRPKDLSPLPILSLDEKAAWWNNFLSILPAADRPVFQTVIRINHIRGLINGALESMGVTFVPRYSVARELDQGHLTDVFPGMPIKADEFCIYVKQERMKSPKIQAVITYLKQMFLALGDEL